MTVWLKVWTIGLLLMIMTLMCIGLVTIYSSTCDTQGAGMFTRQAIWIGCGLIGCLVIALVPLEVMARHSNILLLLIGALLLYLACAFLINKFISEDFVKMMPFLETGKTKGSFRWLKFHGFGVQPSEFAKFALLLFLAAYYGTRSKAVIDTFFRGALIPALHSGAILGLILLGQDMSSTVIVSFMVCGIMFCAGVKLRHLAIFGAVGLVGLAVMVALSPVRMRRITSFIKARQQVVQENNGVKVKTSQADKDDRHQIEASKLALGGGGLKGRGFTQSFMKKNTYLPENHTDFILAIWGEEMGFFGTLVVLLCYMGLMASLIGLACTSQDRVGMLLCMGFCLLVTMQAIVNIGVISDWGPTTGVTAPFVSYGGSSMLALLCCCGLIFNVCIRTAKALREKRVKGSNMPTYVEIRTMMNEDAM